MLVYALVIYLIAPDRPSPEESNRTFEEITAQLLADYGSRNVISGTVFKREHLSELEN